MFKSKKIKSLTKRIDGVNDCLRLVECTVNVPNEFSNATVNPDSGLTGLKKVSNHSIEEIPVSLSTINIADNQVPSSTVAPGNRGSATIDELPPAVSESSTEIRRLFLCIATTCRHKQISFIVIYTFPNELSYISKQM